MTSSYDQFVVDNLKEKLENVTISLADLREGVRDAQPGSNFF